MELRQPNKKAGRHHNQEVNCVDVIKNYVNVVKESSTTILFCIDCASTHSTIDSTHLWSKSYQHVNYELEHMTDSQKGLLSMKIHMMGKDIHVSKVNLKDSTEY